MKDHHGSPACRTGHDQSEADEKKENSLQKPAAKVQNKNKLHDIYIYIIGWKMQIIHKFIVHHCKLCNCTNTRTYSIHHYGRWSSMHWFRILIFCEGLMSGSWGALFRGSCDSVNFCHLLPQSSPRQAWNFTSHQGTMLHQTQLQTHPRLGPTKCRGKGSEIMSSDLRAAEL